MSKLISLCVIAIFFTQATQAQSTLNAASNEVTVDGKQYAYTIGEMSLVTTNHSPTLIVTQGYYQPHQMQTIKDNEEGSNSPLLASVFQVFPNPTTNALNIICNHEVQKISMELNDASGRIVYTKIETDIELAKKYTIEMKSYAVGNYFLRLKMISKANQQNTLTYKIQKIGN